MPAFGLYSAPTHPVIADPVEMSVEEGIVDLARPRLVSSGIVRKLDMRDAVEVRLDGTGEIPLHDLHVVDVILQIQIVRADLFDNPQRLFRIGQKESGNVTRIDRFDEQFDACRLQFLRRKGKISRQRRLRARRALLPAAQCPRDN